ncbi:MAG: helix-turn-helix transcriptional regulator [Magnetococcales bacterium]|nr:helix-turn-helix transcriptional regulator [Magnetococcales bacterium]
MKTTFAQRIRMARKHGGFKQAGLANQVGVSQTAIHKLENGFSRSSRFTVPIALSCGVDPVWLETGDGMMVPGRSGSTSVRRKPASPSPCSDLERISISPPKPINPPPSELEEAMARAMFEATPFGSSASWEQFSIDSKNNRILEVRAAIRIFRQAGWRPPE